MCGCATEAQRVSTGTTQTSSLSHPFARPSPSPTTRTRTQPAIQPARQVLWHPDTQMSRHKGTETQRYSRTKAKHIEAPLHPSSVPLLPCTTQTRTQAAIQPAIQVPRHPDTQTSTNTGTQAL